MNSYVGSTVEARLRGVTDRDGLVDALVVPVARLARAGSYRWHPRLEELRTEDDGVVCIFALVEQGEPAAPDRRSDQDAAEDALAYARSLLESIPEWSAAAPAARRVEIVARVRHRFELGYTS